MPDDWREGLTGCGAIFFDAVGWPETLPDHVWLGGSLLLIRREFDQYVNLRPTGLFDGVPCPLAARKPGDIDLVFVRKNTEGEYISVGRRMARPWKALAAAFRRARAVGALTPLRG